MRTFLVCLLIATALGGCTDKIQAAEGAGAGDDCPDDALKGAAFLGAERFVQEDLFSNQVTMRMEGTMDGEVGDMLLAVDPAAKAFRMSDDETEMRIVGAEMSIEDGEDSIYARNHAPDAFWTLFVNSFAESMAEDSAVFIDEAGVDDYDASCSTRGTTEVIEFSFTDGGSSETIVVERAAPHRPFSGTTIDPATQDNFRASFSYDKPVIRVDASLPRMPLAIAYTLDAEANGRGGVMFEGVLTAETQWAPFSELSVTLEDDDFEYFNEGLEDRFYDWGDGDWFDFEDLDDNGMLSAGDRFTGDLGPELMFQFYDDWAESYANEMF